MTPETDQTASPAGDKIAAADRSAGDKKAGTKEGNKPRAGVPVWRTGKPDAFLHAVPLAIHRQLRTFVFFPPLTACKRHAIVDRAIVARGARRRVPRRATVSTAA